MPEKIIVVENSEYMQKIIGTIDENINYLQSHYNVSIVARGESLKINGNEADVDMCYSSVSILLQHVIDGQNINIQAVRYIASMVDDGKQENITSLSDDGICVTSNGKTIKPKTLGQKMYIDSIRKNTIVFGVGPAGTGKTYLAVALAVKAFKSHTINKIILTRPAVEAGEKLGFLPGDMQEKVDPYLRPLYDALFDTFGAETFQRLVEKGSIEVAPLAYMRGRTLDDAFIILDEAQNTTPEQIKMFLTRLGFNSKMVITGDITQIDLPNSQKSGLKEAIKVLHDVDDIDIVKFSEKDVVRHHLVQEIVKAYEKYNKEGSLTHGKS